MTPDGRARLEDRLGRDEPPYRSRGEAQLGRLLDRYGLPFVYEQPTPIFDRRRHRTWHPDFTLPSYGGLILEYAGMMDVPAYAAGARHKRRAYARNGLRALFVYPRDLHGPSWSERLVARIHRVAYDRRPMRTSRRCSRRPPYTRPRFYWRGPRYRAIPPRTWPYRPRYAPHPAINLGYGR